MLLFQIYIFIMCYNSKHNCSIAHVKHPIHVVISVPQTHRDQQLPYSVVCQHLLVCEGNFEWTILFGPLIWPVLFTLLLSPLHSICYHGNHTNLFLPHQPPEVINSVWEGTCKIQNFSWKPCTLTEMQVACSSPWVAMYFLSCEYPWMLNIRCYDVHLF